MDRYELLKFWDGPYELGMTWIWLSLVSRLDLVLLFAIVLLMVAKPGV